VSRVRAFLSPLQLLDLTRFYASEVHTGAYPFIDFDPDDRWHQRIYRDRRMDVWLISWLPTQRTELHDHGGSSGSFTVLSGTLTETVVSNRAIRDSERGPGDAVAFGPHYVHDVRNASAAPAVSVHAYSPPLTTMTYYDLADGELVPIASVATDQPEPVFDGRLAS
jgi:quercetin dioxygenase-like cupin family protein